MKSGYVYMMSNRTNLVLYVGVTSNLPFRVAQHKAKADPNSFTAKYNCTKLVYYAFFENIADAIIEEKRIKGGNRKRKNEMVIAMNPEWKDLYGSITERNHEL